MASRVQIPFSFNYPSGGNLVPAANVSVSVYIRNNDGSQGATAPVFQSQAGNSQYSSMQTDSGGNVPGWVAEGTYKIVAAASGGFGGGTINFDALYGGGTSAIATGAVGPSQIAANAVGSVQLDPSIAQALVPPGVILDYSGNTPPSGFLSCNGSIVAQSTYPALFSAIGTAWNTGGEGTGNFRLPNATNRFLLGSGGTKVLANSGGALGHTHGAGTLSFPVSVSTTVGQQWVTGTIPGLSVNAHAHSLGAGFAVINPASIFSNYGLEYLPKGGLPVDTTAVAWGSTSWNYSAVTAAPGVGVALAGTTDADGASTAALGFGTGWMVTSGGTYGGSGSTSTGSGASAASDPPYIVVNKIIKY